MTPQRGGVPPPPIITLILKHLAASGKSVSSNGGELSSSLILSALHLSNCLITQIAVKALMVLKRSERRHGSAHEGGAGCFDVIKGTFHGVQQLLRSVALIGNN